jgi:hypothetical protein
MVPPPGQQKSTNCLLELYQLNAPRLRSPPYSSSVHVVYHEIAIVFHAAQGKDITVGGADRPAVRLIHIGTDWDG